jgi:hypothetical protein
MLQFDPDWRFNSPGTVDSKVVSDVLQQVINRVAGDCSRQHILETFKRRFAQSTGSTTGTSTSESWAESDLEWLMSQSANENAALFAEALHGGLVDMEAMNVNAAIPPWDYVNKFLAPSGFVISPPHLVTTAQYKPGNHHHGFSRRGVCEWQRHRKVLLQNHCRPSKPQSRKNIGQSQCVARQHLWLFICSGWRRHSLRRNAGERRIDRR